MVCSRLKYFRSRPPDATATCRLVAFVVKTHALFVYTSFVAHYLLLWFAQIGAARNAGGLPVSLVIEIFAPAGWAGAGFAVGTGITKALSSMLSGSE